MMRFPALASLLAIFAAEAGALSWSEQPTFENAFEHELCATVYCGAGEECRLEEDGVGRCACLPTAACEGHTSPLCASDARSYVSHCHMHQAACERGENGECSSMLSQILHPEPAATTQPPPVRHEFANDADDEYDYDLEDLEGGRVELESVSGLPFDDVKAPSIVPLRDTLESPRRLAYDFHPAPPTEGTKPTEETKTAPTTATTSRCDDSDYMFLLNNLLLYFHAKFGDGSAGVASGKARLVGRMFGAWDGGRDGFLSSGELAAAESSGPQYDKLLPSPCHLPALLAHGDTDRDGRLSLKEFAATFGLEQAATLAALSQASQSTSAPLKSESPVKTKTALVGAQIQLLCTLTPSPGSSSTIWWSRYGRPLSIIPAAGLRLEAASLYLAPAATIHSGNFTCHLGDASQTHVVAVLRTVKVIVEPEFLLLKRGEAGRLRCRLDGLSPLSRPHVHWEKNGQRLQRNSSDVVLASAEESETGSYACVASWAREGRTRRASASVVVRDAFHQPEKTLRRAQAGQAPHLAILHSGGVDVVEVGGCSLERRVRASYIAPALARPSLCPGLECRWAAWVAVGDSGRLVVAQHGLRSLFLVHVGKAAVLQELRLSAVPLRLWHVAGSDDVWVEMAGTDGQRSLGVLRRASTAARLSLTHALPLADAFGSVQEAFLPPSDEARFAYVRTSGGGLGKVDLHSLSLVSSLDLSFHNCSPKAVAFLPTVGLAAINCGSGASWAGRQVVVDVVSDVVLAVHESVAGEAALSPDGLSLVSVDAGAGRIFVQDIRGKALVLRLTIDEFLPLGGWVVSSSLLAASPNSSALVSISLSDGRVTAVGKLGGSGQSFVASLGAWGVGLGRSGDVSVWADGRRRCRVQTPTPDVAGVLRLPKAFLPKQ